MAPRLRFRRAMTLSKSGQQYVVGKLRVMYGDTPPADALGEVLVRLSLARLKELARTQDEAAREEPRG